MTDRRGLTTAVPAAAEAAVVSHRSGSCWIYCCHFQWGNVCLWCRGHQQGPEFRKPKWVQKQCLHLTKSCIIYKNEKKTITDSKCTAALLCQKCPSQYRPTWCRQRRWCVASHPTGTAWGCSCGGLSSAAAFATQRNHSRTRNLSYKWKSWELAVVELKERQMQNEN